MTEGSRSDTGVMNGKGKVMERGEMGRKVMDKGREGEVAMRGERDTKGKEKIT